MNSLILQGPRKLDTPFGALELPFAQNLVRGATPTSDVRVPATVMLDGQPLDVTLNTALTRGIVAQPAAFVVTDASASRETAERAAERVAQRAPSRAFGTVIAGVAAAPRQSEVSTLEKKA